MLSRLLLPVVLGASVALGADSQGTPAVATIVVGQGVRISADKPTRPHAESFLALDPKNSAHLLATSIAFEGGRDVPVVYRSRDSGRTWHPSEAFKNGVSALAGGDPIVHFDGSGTALFGAIGPRPEGFRVWRSVDGGDTWSNVSTVPGGFFDRQYLASDRSGRYSGRIYAAGAVLVRRMMENVSGFAIGVSYSVDGGVTFTPPVLIETAASGYGVSGVADPVISTDGTLVLPFEAVALDRGAAQRGASLWTIVSHDGGRTFTGARPGPRIGHGSGFRELKTHGARRAVIDASEGPFRDRLYAAWVDFASDRYDIKVSYSDDFGSAWSQPAIVNDNVVLNDPANPAITVNDAGVVAVVFNDRRDDPGNQCYRLYATASLDGGSTFLPNVPVNAAVTCPHAVGNWPGAVFTSLRFGPEGRNAHQALDISGIPERFPNGGDTQGLEAGPEGRFHVAWINGTSGVMQLWHSSFVVAGPGGAPQKRRLDVTHSIRVEASAPSIDFEKRTLLVRVSLQNDTANTIQVPLTLVLDRMESGLGGLAAANADNGLSREGAQWAFRSGATAVLRPGEHSESRELIWKFDGNIPLEPRDRLRLRFRVLQ